MVFVAFGDRVLGTERNIKAAERGIAKCTSSGRKVSIKRQGN